MRILGSVVGGDLVLRHAAQAWKMQPRKWVAAKKARRP
jgi:hypothetical protein